ncbi:MAG: protein-glutamate O-methyltransferase CheR [Pseudomonadota bacterium]
MCALAARDFERIAALMHREAGIELTEGKMPLVHSRLSARLKSLRLATYGDYCDFIESAAGEAERLEMLSVLTTNVTRFYREAHHFDYLEKAMVPQMRAALDAGRSVRVWSAGCSTGEEPYSLALTFLAAIPALGKADFRILATDIDPAVLDTAAQGIYPSRSLKSVPEEQKQRYFSAARAAPDMWEVGQEIKDLVSFRHLNLISDWPFKRKFDVIMCRNVVIYFSLAAKSHVWPRLLDQLRPGGLLITGHSERLPPEAAEYAELVHKTTYRRLSVGTFAEKR